MLGYLESSPFSAAEPYNTDSKTDFKFDEIEKAYDVFNRAAETNALKVNIEF